MITPHTHLKDAIDALDRAEGKHLWSQARPHYREAIDALQQLTESLPGTRDVKINTAYFIGLVRHLMYQIAELEASPVAGVATDENNEPEQENKL